MAYEFGGQTISLISSGNLSAKQFHCVALSTGSTGVGKLQTTQGGFVIGVQQNTPSTGGTDGLSVMVLGVTKVAKNSTAVAAIARRAALISSTAGGCMPTTKNGYVWGRALSAMASGTTGYLPALITHEGTPGVSTAIV